MVILEIGIGYLVALSNTESTWGQHGDILHRPTTVEKCPTRRVRFPTPGRRSCARQSPGTYSSIFASQRKHFL
jgi:hypothetical protein